MRRKARILPDQFDVSRLRHVRSVREFDEAFTAPHHGFKDSGDYYYRASSLRVVDRIVIPTLILSADDDPFVPVEQFTNDALLSNPAVTVIVTHGGGHCGFFTNPDAAFDGYWAEQMAVVFSEQHL